MPAQYCVLNRETGQLEQVSPETYRHVTGQPQGNPKPAPSIAGPMKPVPGLVEKPVKSAKTNHLKVERLKLHAEGIKYTESKKPWNSFGEYLQAVARAARPGGYPEARLVRAPSGMQEADASAGGFLVAEEFAQDVIQSLYLKSPFLGQLDRRQAKLLGAINIPAIDESSRADGSRSGGAQAFWAQGEGVSVSNSWPHYKRVAFTPKKLMAVVPVTGELLADAPMLATVVRNALVAELEFKLSAAIISGTGAGQPLGLLNAPALIIVAKDTGQASKTITPTNVLGMWSRLAPPCKARACWLVAENVEDALASINNAATTLYTARGVYGNEDPLLLGRPVYFTEQSPLLGSQGDIILLDGEAYTIVDGGIGSTLSTHVRFLNDEPMFRFVYRVDAQPLWASSISRYQGGATVSPYVTLATRP
jgi:HK97 family phage major capsid protein